MADRRRPFPQRKTIPRPESRPGNAAWGTGISRWEFQHGNAQHLQWEDKSTYRFDFFCPRKLPLRTGFVDGLSRKGGRKSI